MLFRVHSLQMLTIGKASQALLNFLFCQVFLPSGLCCFTVIFQLYSNVYNTIMSLTRAPFVVDLFTNFRDVKKRTGDWFYDQRVNRFSMTPAHDLVRASLRKRHQSEFRKCMPALSVPIVIKTCGKVIDLYDCEHFLLF